MNGISLTGIDNLKNYNLIGRHIGRETIKIINYSAGAVKYRISLNIGLQYSVNSKGDYSDIEFGW